MEGFVYDSNLINKDPEYIEKCSEYMKYLEQHIGNVIDAFETYFKDRMDYVFENNSAETNKQIAKIMDDKVRNHDSSKYSDDEFNQYRMNFYPTTMELERLKEDEAYNQEVMEIIQQSFIHHVRVNSHHAEFYHYNYTESTDGLQITAIHPYNEYSQEEVDMYICDVIEMICDWISMSRFVRDIDCYIEWYASDESKEERTAMSTDTQILVETITSKLFPDEYAASNSNVWILKNEE